MPKVPRLPRLPGRQQEMNRLYGRYNELTMNEYHPNRADWERWKSVVEEERARRRYIDNMMRLEYAYQRGYAPWGERTRAEFYSDPLTLTKREFPPTPEEFWARSANYSPYGEEWLDKAAFSDKIPQRLRLLPEEADMMQQESYGDTDQLLDDLMNLRIRWERRSLPEFPEE